ncbi:MULTISPECIES: alpha/beta fold hydrolase [Actinomyces]|uniref:Alpha/beta hydrolase n=1 Tax=Actinomyces respiraculi TaxID=2744574 RepID=A0A7T0PVR8_9ACTO|nr:MULTISPECIES: alpha/beta hydrolase [Actinomyces]QPL04959.1 alpha/beta hydrolase [Actinomyces respiraculi]
MPALRPRPAVSGVPGSGADDGARAGAPKPAAGGADAGGAATSGPAVGSPERWARRAGVTARRLRPPGAGEPTLVLLAGAGLGSAFWEPVLGLLPGTHVVVDRQGRLGTHCHGLPALHTQAGILARLLEDLGVADGAPTVLVAHSMAAFEAELLARRRPGLVDGIVLVDPSVAHQPRLTPVLAVGAVRGRAPLAALGLAATRGLLKVPGAHRGLAALARASMRGMVTRPQALDSPAWQDTWTVSSLTGGAAESLAYSAQQADLLRSRALADGPVRVPTLLLQAPPYASRGRLASARRAFSRLVVREVPDSGHFMTIDAPQEVARAVREVMAMLDT